MPLTKATTNVVNLNKDTIINGLTVGRGGAGAGSNTAVGLSALQANTTGFQNTAIGQEALKLNTTGQQNTAVGMWSLEKNTTGDFNTAVGRGALNDNTTGVNNTANGAYALYNNIAGSANTAVGRDCLIANNANDNTAVGSGSMYENTSGINNTAVGRLSLTSNATGSNNTAIGHSAMFSNTGGVQNVGIGRSSLFSNTTGIDNTACGWASLRDNETGERNSAFGRAALLLNSSGDENTSIGYNSGSGVTTEVNVTCLGTSSAVTGSNQVQLGSSATTTYAYGAVQNRSDIRDKADVRDTELGLEFVNALRPVDFKWDMREDYRPEAPAPVSKPADLKEDATEEEKAKYAQELAAYNAYVVEKDKWLEDVKLANITHDGSKKRNRFHHGLIAQEVKSVLDAKGIDFGGFQDHSVKGGDDVLSIGYVELIAPMLKAIQELSAKVAELEAK
jgi:hypothetical protein